MLCFVTFTEQLYKVNQKFMHNVLWVMYSDDTLFPEFLKQHTLIYGFVCVYIMSIQSVVAKVYLSLFVVKKTESLERLVAQHIARHMHFVTFGALYMFSYSLRRRFDYHRLIS